MDMLKLFSHKRLLMEIIYICIARLILRTQLRRLCEQPMGINRGGPPQSLYMGQHLTDRLSLNCINYVRAVGGPHIGALLHSAGCFESESLESLWVDDEEGWDLYFKAHRVVRSLEDALCSRSSHAYSVPDERTFRTLVALTEYMADLLAQSFVLDSQYPSSLIHVGLAKLTLDLLEDSDLDSCILLGFIVELAVSVGESQKLVRALEAMKPSGPSKEMVIETITAHATGRLEPLTVVGHEEVMV